MNPFDHRNTYQNLVADEQMVNGYADSNVSDEDLRQENLDLKRQVLLFQQQLDERDKTIRLLQNQMVLLLFFELLLISLFLDKILKYRRLNPID